LRKIFEVAFSDTWLYFVQKRLKTDVLFVNKKTTENSCRNTIV